MSIQKWVILITLFLIINTYYDGKFTAYLLKGKKYYTMAMYAFIGLSIYMFIKKHPSESKNMFLHANTLVRHLPIDKGAGEILTPFMDFTNIQETFNQLKPIQNVMSTQVQNKQNYITPQMKRMLQSGGCKQGILQKRCVSESKKKYVASKQGWHCAICNNMLDATYEVDHVELQDGGSNHVSNLAALCSGVIE